MACLTQETDDCPTTYSPTTPHFFKIIVNDTSKYNKIKIPTKFVMKYGDGLSNSVVLKVPSGLEWEMEPRRYDGEVWFEKGWPDFSHFYSLDFAYWLVFGYEGNSKFLVRIFDRSCTEIDYPLQTPEEEETDEDSISNNSDHDSSDDARDDYEAYSGDDSVQILDEFSPCQREPKGRSPLPCPRPHKENITSSGGKAGPSARAKAKALQMVSSFTSEYPFLKVAMQPTYLQYCYLSLRSKFVKKHLSKTCDHVFLRRSDGRTWRVKLEQYETGRCRLLSGWKKFVQENSLAIGDVCVFVLIDNIKPLFNVIFFPTT
ncbi:B3 domain-containing transcription factor VRN1-like [Pyrus ussuriensis x Pyrus communis]|uniref:B3 domain-containing transcription factor VRN1-like n=1 Tax=Pyrus ussuriensis x Pyrus communis TaxID=2448454 RepID=A0A5N5GX14_9ROSA|nr:B3 domain-containing transcription factor VRN1-like [Pyrus ussuriensis x Pyrus communis]